MSASAGNVSGNKQKKKEEVEDQNQTSAEKSDGGEPVGSRLLALKLYHKVTKW